MEIKIKKLEHTLPDIEGKPVRGYAFSDKEGRCILIRYGEANLKNWKTLLQK